MGMSINTENKHFAKAKRLYEKKGATAVYDYAIKESIPCKRCEGCDADTPQINSECLICGQKS